MQRDEVRGGTTIRNPSTANLLIDSSDRDGGTSANFTIQKKNSILNGFFSRLAVSEVILNWSVPNISSATSNDVFSINIDGVGVFNSLEDDGSDELYEQAKEEVLRAGKASTSYIQRKLRVGYSRAARLVDLLEKNGVIGPGDGAKAREVIGANKIENVEEKPLEGVEHNDGDYL